MRRSVSCFAICLAIVFLTSLNAQEFKGPELNEKTYSAWQQHIQPTEDELAWRKIDWLPDLKSGIDQATKVGRPIMLWTMNGHPFGCT